MATEDQGLHRASESPPILTGQITGRQVKALTGEGGKGSDRRERTGEQKREKENSASGVTLTLPTGNHCSRKKKATVQKEKDIISKEKNRPICP